MPEVLKDQNKLEKTSWPPCKVYISSILLSRPCNFIFLIKEWRISFPKLHAEESRLQFETPPSCITYCSGFFFKKKSLSIHASNWARRALQWRLPHLFWFCCFCWIVIMHVGCLSLWITINWNRKDSSVAMRTRGK